MESVRDVLVALARGLAFRDLAFLVGTGVADAFLSRRDAARVQQLCAYGQRLLELDSEDLANADASAGAATDTSVADLVGGELVPEDLVERGRRARMPQQPQERPRAALRDLRPAYRLLLEAMAAHWTRHQMLGVVAGAYIAAEYAPLLAWQPVLGHAADPLRLGTTPAFTGERSHWGHLDDRVCPHTTPEKAAANRSLRVAHDPGPGWQRYLDRQHSLVARALARCASGCDVACAVTGSITPAQRERLREAGRIAEAFRGCALVRLRHAAPVGHGFGVPSPDEVADAWRRSRLSLVRRGGLGRAVLVEDGYPLPGMLSLFSAVAGGKVAPDTLLADTAARIAELLAGIGVPA